MKKRFHYHTIPNLGDEQSSAFLFDLRNSTTIIRKISWDDRLEKHAAFMTKLHEMVYDTLYRNYDSKNFAMNDTGDGYLCVFWGEDHALKCLDMAIAIKTFLEVQLPAHNKDLKRGKDTEELDFGFGMHSGASTIKRMTYKTPNEEIRKDFIFGIAANTAARLEAFTKPYFDVRFLVTGNYRDNYLKQTKRKKELGDIFQNDGKYFYRYPGRVNIRDGKENEQKRDRKKGHLVYALKEGFLKKFKEHYPTPKGSKTQRG